MSHRVFSCVSIASGSILEEIQRIENIPGFVYLIRNKDLFKIGITVSMQRRMKELKPDEVIAVKQAANMRGIEKVLHKRYKHQRIPQTEYFRLSSEEVSEATLFLGGEVAADFVVQDSAKSELKELQKIASRKQRTLIFSKEVKEMVDDAENLLFNLFSLNNFYDDYPDSETGEIKSAMDWWRSGDLIPSPKLVMNQRTRDACDRRAIREDILLPIAGAETDQEAGEEVQKLIDDFSLILCWAYRNDYINIEENKSELSDEGLILQFESRLVDRSIWYTDQGATYGVKPSGLTPQRQSSSIKFGTPVDYLIATAAGIVFGGWFFVLSPLVIWQLSRQRRTDIRLKDAPRASLWFAWAFIGVLVIFIRTVISSS